VRGKTSSAAITIGSSMSVPGRHYFSGILSIFRDSFLPKLELDEMPPSKFLP
jgi:hypothetical protein